MSDTSSNTVPGGETASPRSWLSAEVDGRPVAFWVAVSLVIAVVVLGFGAWRVWGLDEDMPGEDTPMGEDTAMGEMPHTDVRLPPVAGLYAGEEIFFVHPEASEPDVAGMLTEMMDGSPVLVVPELAEVPPGARDDVYVFANGIEGTGPFGFQPDVFPTVPGDEDYSPLRTVVLVTWSEPGEARELRSADEVVAAEEAGEIELDQTGVVVNMPMLTWPGGQR